MENLLYELIILCILGMLYYYYQKRKILSFEENKAPYIMGSILQSCLTVRGEEADSELDSVIEALDDFLHNKTNTPPSALLNLYSESSSCSPELRDVILQGLEDLSDGKK